ncbi:MAG TPA: hypothetical protein VMZ50_07040 [Phycisphaerae bacterium]|nr:hypothetical protein [Phycisphaerae bacterium]
MKRTAMLLLVALGVGIAAGAVGSGKFKYLSDRWNRPADVTEIELACIQSAFRAEKPVPLVRDLLLATEVQADPRATHIRLTVQVQVLENPARRLAPADLAQAASAVYAHWRETLLKRSLPDQSTCPVTIDLVQGLKTLFRQIRDAKGVRGFENPDV